MVLYNLESSIATEEPFSRSTSLKEISSSPKPKSYEQFSPKIRSVLDTPILIIANEKTIPIHRD